MSSLIQFMHPGGERPFPVPAPRAKRIALEQPLADVWHQICDQLRKQGFVLAVDLQYPPSM
jgi:hypothetical protein